MWRHVTFTFLAPVPPVWHSYFIVSPCNPGQPDFEVHTLISTAKDWRRNTRGKWMNEHSHPMPFFPSGMPLSLMFSHVETSWVSSGRHPLGSPLHLPRRCHCAFLSLSAFNVYWRSRHLFSLLSILLLWASLWYVYLSTQKVPSPCTSLCRPSFPTEDASQSGKSGSQVRDPQVLTLTVCLWALLSASVPSRRVVWQWNVLLYPEYLAPGLVWVRLSVTIISTNKWESRWDHHDQWSQSKVILFFLIPVLPIFLSVWNLTIFRLFIYMPVCIPGAL